jgi:hypothetical protein
VLSCVLCCKLKAPSGAGKAFFLSVIRFMASVPILRQISKTSLFGLAKKRGARM